MKSQGASLYSGQLWRVRRARLWHLCAGSVPGRVWQLGRDDAGLAEPGWERKGKVLERRSPPGAGRPLTLGYVGMVKR